MSETITFRTRYRLQRDPYTNQLTGKFVSDGIHQVYPPIEPLTVYPPIGAVLIAYTDATSDEPISWSVTLPLNDSEASADADGQREDGT